MEIAGVDYPDRPERFEVVYQLLSLTKNRARVKVSTDEATPVPSVTALWPVAGWLEREVFDMYGVGFAGNPDLRGSSRITVRGLSAAQGLPADRPCRAALFRGREARRL
jgi:NADH:ubiquinone oxidoreductase subunit C